MDEQWNGFLLLKGEEGLLGEESFHQPTMNKIVFYDAWGNGKQFQILFSFFSYTVLAT